MWTVESRERYRDDSHRYPSDLTEAEWATIAPMMSVYRTLTANMREIIKA